MFGRPTRKNAAILVRGNDSIFDSIKYKIGLQEEETIGVDTQQSQQNTGNTDKK